MTLKYPRRNARNVAFSDVFETVEPEKFNLGERWNADVAQVQTSNLFLPRICRTDTALVGHDSRDATCSSCALLRRRVNRTLATVFVSSATKGTGFTCELLLRQDHFEHQ